MWLERGGRWDTELKVEIIGSLSIQTQRTWGLGYHTPQRFDQSVSGKHGGQRSQRTSEAFASVFNKQNLTWEAVVIQDLTTKGEGKPEWQAEEAVLPQRSGRGCEPLSSTLYPDKSTHWIWVVLGVPLCQAWRPGAGAPGPLGSLSTVNTVTSGWGLLFCLLS